MSDRYMLDTNICIYIIKNNPMSVRQKFERVRASDLVLSIVTLAELRYGAEKSQARAKAIRAVEQLTAYIEIADLDEVVAEHYADIRATLERVGTPIGNHDLWLAAYARANNWILVSNNIREFERVEGLRLENWLSASC
jgi:tRNA(fMet)-specific endonuclease VapC